MYSGATGQYLGLMLIVLVSGTIIIIRRSDQQLYYCALRLETKIHG